MKQVTRPYPDLPYPTLRYPTQAYPFLYVPNSLHRGQLDGMQGFHGARLVHQIISMTQWIRTCSLSIINSLDVRESETF